MPDGVRWSLIQFAFGGLAGLLFAAGLVVMDVGALGALAAQDDGAWIALALLALNAAALFGIAACASALTAPLS